MAPKCIISTINCLIYTFCRLFNVSKFVDNEFTKNAKEKQKHIWFNQQAAPSCVYKLIYSYELFESISIKINLFSFYGKGTL